MTIIEKLDFQSCFILLRNISRNQIVYYIDSSKFERVYILILHYFFNINLKKFDFKLMDVRSNKNELIRLKIDREDLFDVQKEIKKNICFIKNKKIFDYILRDFTTKSGGIQIQGSITRTLFIFEVLEYFQLINKNNENLIILDYKPWFNFSEDFFKKYEIKIILKTGLLYTNISMILTNIFFHFPTLHQLLFNLKYIKKGQFSKKINYNNNNNIIAAGMGDINFLNNGFNSDFFWLFNSNLSKKDIIYHNHKQLSNNDKNILLQNNIKLISAPFFLKQASESFNSRINVHKTFTGGQFDELSLKKIKKYSRYYKEWYSIFKKYKVKVYLDWQRFSSDHYIINDAINDLGGISALYQIAFNSHPFIDSQAKSDIFFVFSKFSAENEIKNLSDSKYYIISGLPRDYSVSLLKPLAQELRNSLYENGVNKIVSIFDENSSDDSRWHTGHELQKENYEYLIEELFRDKTLGIIFKPKALGRFKIRLGETYERIQEAIKTRRCILLDNKIFHPVNKPAVLAGLASDLSIHSHFCAGTAAIECAAASIPVIMIDREGSPYSILSQLPKGKLVHENWESAIQFIRNYKIDQKNEVLKEWSFIIDELDPFRDGLASSRISDYLGWILEGYRNFQKSDQILMNAAEKYTKKWGKDKIITKLIN